MIVADVLPGMLECELTLMQARELRDQLDVHLQRSREPQ